MIPVQENVQFIITSTIESPSHFNLDDNFESGLVKQKMLYIFDEVFFDYNHGEFCSHNMKATSSIIQQWKEKKPMITVSPDDVEARKRLGEVYFTKVLETFFPSFSHDTIIELQKNVNFTISGLVTAFHYCFPSSNLLEQITKIFMPSERYLQVHKAQFPDIEELEPIPFEVSLSSMR